MFRGWFRREGSPEGASNSGGRYRNGNERLIELRQVVKRYESTAGVFTALKGIDLGLGPGQCPADFGCR
jgi:putative ABC transport system ATP-binding protein